MNHNRRKILTEQENEIPSFEPATNVFARVIGCRAGDLFDVETLPADAHINDTDVELIPQMVRLPARFKHVIWAKAGDLVILYPEDAEITSRCSMFISSILSPQHIKYFMQQNLLPSVLIPEKFAHKSFARFGVIQATNANERFLGGNNNNNSDEDDEDDEFLESIDNRKKNPFADSSSDDESD